MFYDNSYDVMIFQHHFKLTQFLPAVPYHKTAAILMTAQPLHATSQPVLGLHTVFPAKGDRHLLPTESHRNRVGLLSAVLS